MQMVGYKMNSERKWCILVATCISVFINYGALLSLGSLFVPVSERFGANRTATALVQSLMLATLAIALVAGFLIDRYGLARTSMMATSFLICGFGGGFFATKLTHIYICVSVIAGIGGVSLYMCNSVAIDIVTKGRVKFIALAILNICVGLGAIVFPYLLNHLEFTYGLNGTWLIVSGLCCNNICLVIMFSNVSPDTHSSAAGVEMGMNKGNNSDLVSESRDANGLITSAVSRLKVKALTMCSGLYVLNLIATVPVLSTSDAYLALFVDIYIWKGYSEEQALISTTPFQIGWIITGVTVVVLKLSKKANSFVLAFAYSLAGFAGMLLIYFSKSWPIAYAGSALMGAMNTGVWAVAQIIVAELVSEQQFGTAYGLVVTSLACVSISIVPLCATAVDATHSYNIVFLTLGAMQMFSALLYLRCWFLQLKSKAMTTVDDQRDSNQTCVADSSSYAETETHM